MLLQSNGETSSKKEEKWPEIKVKNTSRQEKLGNKQLDKHPAPGKKAKLLSELVDIEQKLMKSYESSQEHDKSTAVKAISKNSKYFFNYTKRYSKTACTIGSH